MRVLNLYCENIKRLTAVDITPEEDCVVVSGMNENGKTSAIDSIWLAVKYRAASKTNPVPLREGTQKGIIVLDIGDYIVTRKFSSTGNTILEVRTPDGSKIKSPQALLDGLVSDLSFDPWAWSRMDEKQQREMLGDILLELTNGSVNLAEFDAKIEEAAEERKLVKREVKRLESLVSNMRAPTSNDPTKEESVVDVSKRLDQAVRKRSLLDQRAELEKKMRQIDVDLAAIDEIMTVDELRDKLSSIETNNRRAREVVEYNKFKDSLSSLKDQVKELSDKIELTQINKDEALEESDLPVDGLKLTADGIMISNENGDLVPFKQASAARKLKISLGIAMAANPKLRVIRIADGSLLDDESMKIVKNMAKDEDFQVWIEYASRNKDDKIGVYIEDGAVHPY